MKIFYTTSFMFLGFRRYLCLEFYQFDWTIGLRVELAAPKTVSLYLLCFGLFIDWRRDTV